MPKNSQREAGFVLYFFLPSEGGGISVIGLEPKIAFSERVTERIRIIEIKEHI